VFVEDKTSTLYYRGIALIVRSPELVELLVEEVGAEVSADGSLVGGTRAKVVVLDGIAGLCHVAAAFFAEHDD
jgi:hypothetical protein